MRKLSLLLLCCTWLMTSASCKKAEPMPDYFPETQTAATAASVPEASEPTEALPDYTLNDFDQALMEYLWLNGYYDATFVISPAALRASVCLAALGAEGSTKTELLNAAGFSHSEEMHLWYQQFQNMVGASSCLSAVSVWNDRDAMGEFTESYRMQVQQQHFADAFVSPADDMKNALNGWISTRTDGAAPNVQKDVAGASSVLLSTMYLPVELPSGSEGYLYAEDSGTRIVVLPLQEEISLVCFSGNRTDMFSRLSALQPGTMHAALPDVEAEAAFEAGDLLNFLLSRGVNEALNGQKANFYNMCETNDWFLQEILQTAKISLHAAESDDGETESYPCSLAVVYGLGTSEQQLLLYCQLMNEPK